MNMFMLIPLILKAAQYGPQIAEAFRTGQALINIFRQLSPELPGGVLGEAENMFDPEYVRWVQSTLNELGYGPLKIDGEYGRLTKGAVMKFQAATADLLVDGWAGVNTKAALEAALV